MRFTIPTSLVITITALTAAAAAPPTALAVRRHVVDIGQQPGFPAELTATDFFSMPWNLGGVVLADVDGDGSGEVIFSYQRSIPPAAEEGTIEVWRSDGEAFPGFPSTVTGGALFAASVGDLDGDGTQEIVQTTLDDSRTARIYVVMANGAVAAGFPVALGVSYIPMGATLYDLDGDSELEIIFQSDTHVHVIERDGSQWGDGWPVAVGTFALGPPTIGDMNDDGAPEIFVADSSVMHLLAADGGELPGWPLGLANYTFVVRAPAALADLDHDGDLEIVVPTWTDRGSSDSTTAIHVLHHDGAPMTGWPQDDTVPRTECAPIVTDLEGDGDLEILIGSELTVEHQREDGTTYTTHHPQIFAWDSSGTAKAGFPWAAEQPVYGATMLTAADADGDGAMEIYSDSAMGEGYSGFIFGVDATGSELPGFPLRTVGETWENGAVLDDVDGDGDLELGAVSFNDEAGNMSVQVNLFDLPGSYRASSVAWPTYHASNHRGGRCGADRIVIREVAAERGPHNMESID